MNESERAVMESARFAAMDSYFEARPQIAITRKLECIFEAGFDAAYAEFRRLREENERLRIENIALRADADRIDWLADVENTVGSVVLPRHIVEQNIGSLRQAIDAARSAKTLPEPAP